MLIGIITLLATVCCHRQNEAWEKMDISDRQYFLLRGNLTVFSFLSYQ